MNQEWCFTSKVIAQITIVFTTSIYDELKAQIWYVINVAVTRLCTTTMLASALDKVVTLEVKFCSEGSHPTSIKPEATPCDRLDLRTLGHPEESCTLCEKEAKSFHISTLTKEVSNSPTKSTMITDLIKNCAQQKTESLLLS